MLVESGKTTEVNGVLIPSTGLLDITTSPPGAWILIDTNNSGVTPILIPGITVGNHTLTAGKEGFVTAEQRVTVLENRTTQISIILVPDSPSLPETAAPTPVTLIACFLLIFLVIRHTRREY